MRYQFWCWRGLVFTVLLSLSLSLSVPVGGAGSQSTDPLSGGEGVKLALANGGSLADVGVAAGLVAGGVADALVVADSHESLGAGAAGVVGEASPGHVLLVGGTAVLTDAIEAELRELSEDVQLERVWGATRVGTAAAAARRTLAGAGADERRPVVVLANGWSLADVGAAASLVAAGGADAVLYAAGANGLGEVTASVLVELSARRVVLIGGPGALSEQVRADAIAAAGAGVPSRRLGGATRTHTAASAARAGAGRVCVSAALVANGWSDADVVIAAALGAAWGDSIVLYADSAEVLGDAARSAIAELAPQRVVLVGSEESLTDQIRDQLPAGRTAKRVADAHRASRLALAEPPEDCHSSGGGGGGGFSSFSGDGGQSRPVVTALKPVTVSFGLDAHTATEGGAAATVTVSLSAAPERTVLVPVTATPAGSATGSDYTLSARWVLFGATETSKTLTVTANDDSHNDDGESVTLGFGPLTDVRVTVGTPSTTTVHLVDDDDETVQTSVTVSFGLDAHTATEGGAAATVTVSLSAAPERTVLVPVTATPAGSATGSDYTLSARWVLFGATETSKTLTVTANDDSHNDDGESVTLGFGPLTDVRVTVGTPSTTTVHLVDDDDETVQTSVTVSFGLDAYTATEGGAAATVTVSLSAAPERTVLVPVTATPAGSATGSDYTLSARWVLFGATETSKTLTVTANDDSHNDDGESVTLGFGPLTDVRVTVGTPSTTTVHLVDDDDETVQTSVTVSFGSSAYDVYELGLPTLVTVTLSQAPGRPVEIPMMITSHLGDASESDYMPLPTSVVFGARHTEASFIVTAVKDDAAEADEGFTLGFGALSDGQSLGTRSEAMITLHDRALASGDATVSGVRKTGETLTVHLGTISDRDGVSNPDYSYQWVRIVSDSSETDIRDATQTSYTTTESDKGKRLKVRVSFTDDAEQEESIDSFATSSITGEKTILFSNSGRSSGTNTNEWKGGISQGFFTGSWSHGYTLDTLALANSSSSSRSCDLFVMNLHASTIAGLWSRTPAGWIERIPVTHPAACNQSLANFTPSPQLKLDPDTSYHLAFYKSNGTHVGCGLGISGEVDQFNLSGWGVVGNARQFTGGDSATSNGLAWSKACRYRLRGYLLGSSLYIASMTFTSAPGVNSEYATGDVIEVTVSFNEALAREGPVPELELQIGSNARAMEFIENESTELSWVFRYTVVADDQDDNGVLFERHGLIAHANADLSYREVGDDHTHLVNAAPSVRSAHVTSTPLATNYYGPGEKIKFTLGFNMPVTVTGNPLVRFLHGWGSETFHAAYESGSGTDTLEFEYTVTTTDAAPSGIIWQSCSVSFHPADAITGGRSNRNASLCHVDNGILPAHRIVQNPRPVSLEVTSDPAHGTDSDTYGLADEIVFELVFNQAVTVTGDPQLVFNVSSTTGDDFADYDSGSGTNTLVFKYVVKANDTDSDGIYFYGGDATSVEPLVLDSDTDAEDTIVGATNMLPAQITDDLFPRGGNLVGHKIDHNS